MQNTCDSNENSHQLHHVPAFLKFNPHIVRGFRIGYNLKSLVRSLFQWHNETVNTWTHLLGTLVIFILILSSNLFTQHYHSKHQILRFGEMIKEYQANISQNLKDINRVKSSSNQLALESIQDIGLSLIKYIHSVEKQINVVLKLTEEDGFIERQLISSYLARLSISRQTIEKNLLSYSTRQQSDLKKEDTEYFLNSLQKISLNEDLLQIIGRIQQFGEKVNPIPKWPLLVFIVAASICLTASATFHLFYPHSEKLYKILRKLDFSGVIILIVGSSFPTFIYGASCIENLAFVYLFIMSIVGLTVFGLLLTSYFDPRERQKQKSWLFGLFGVSFLIPLTHILILEYLGQTNDSMLFSHFAKRIIVFGGVYLIGLFIYTVQCPQRFVAGKFDYCGASHQIWHLSVLLALYMTYDLNWDLYYERRMNPCPS